MRDSVDHISIVYQRISNRGLPISEEDIERLDEAKRRHLVDSVVLYTPDLNQKAVYNERAKRKLGLQIALQNKMTHFFTMDADEFYRKSELDLAKDFIVRNRIISSSVKSFMHLRSPIYRSLDTTNVSFISEINHATRIGEGKYFVKGVDPTRGIMKPRSWIQHLVSTRHHHFNPEVIAMFHMNLVRENLVSKLKNTSTEDKNFLSSLEKNIQSWKPGTQFYFPGKGLFEFSVVDNEFGTWMPK